MQSSRSTSRRRVNAKNVDKISDTEDITETDGFVHEQWVEPENIAPTPWKNILIIITLLIGGLVCFGFAMLEFLTMDERSDRFWALLIIGILTIIPGGFYTTQLICILLGWRGHTMDDIRRLG